MTLPKKQCSDFQSLIFNQNYFGKLLFSLQSSKLYKLGVFWNPQDLLLKKGTDIFQIDAPWAEKLTKTRVQFLLMPTVYNLA